MKNEHIKILGLVVLTITLMAAIFTVNNVFHTCHFELDCSESGNETCSLTLEHENKTLLYLEASGTDRFCLRAVP